MRPITSQIPPPPCELTSFTSGKSSRMPRTIRRESARHKSAGRPMLEARRYSRMRSSPKPICGGWIILDVPVMIHPPHIGFGEERMREYRLASSIGRPADLCLALSRLIVRGILEDFPRVKLVSSHGGGGICEVIGRMDYAYELQDEAFFLGSYAPMKIKHAPSHYLKKIHFDSVTYHAPAARLVLDTVGADHLLYGSDAPPLTSLKPRAIKLIEDLNLPPAERDAVFWRNAARMLKLPIAAAAA